ncbi:MAG: redox-regulated ATPase YchF [Patescibacteria group bacterium]|nr:redox-regulated ATPase YchF [Patescibacteria group bacterium]
MSFSIGIIGLPNVGKSTLFKALTKKEVKIAPRPFTTIEPNLGKVSVPDNRLIQISEIIKPEKTTPTTIEFVDIAGLVKEAHKGQGLGNQFLAQIRECDAILQVVRAFENPEVENVLGQIDPLKEIEVVNIELLMKDLETLESSISKLEKKRQEVKKIKILKKIKEQADKGKLISEIELIEEEKAIIKDYRMLTNKPVFYILNTDDKTNFEHIQDRHLMINLKDEEGILELSKKEKKELNLESQLDKLILACYDILSLITFFTVAGGKEVKAWTIVKNSKIPEAGGVVHSDFENKFIRAELIDWNELVSIGSWQKAREKGLIKIVGKDHIISNGDIIEFKI